MMCFSEIRASSINAAARWGIYLPSTLPLLDESLSLRSSIEIVDRTLALGAAVAASYGLPRGQAVSWLNGESLHVALAETELEFLQGDESLTQDIQAQVETLCAFAWALGFLPSLDFGKPCPNHLVSVFPDYRAGDSSARFRAGANLRTLEHILAACDLAYCLHWSITQAALDGMHPAGRVDAYVVIERRRALEWMLSTTEWDDVFLDT